MGHVIQWTDHNAIISFSGHVDYEDIVEADNTLYADARFDSCCYQIFDFTEMSSLSLDEEEMRVISRLDKGAARWNNKLRLAIVSTDEKMIKLTGYYKRQVREIGWKVQQFDALKDAIAWCEE